MFYDFKIKFFLEDSFLNSQLKNKESFENNYKSVFNKPNNEIQCYKNTEQNNSNFNKDNLIIIDEQSDQANNDIINRINENNTADFNVDEINESVYREDSLSNKIRSENIIKKSKTQMDFFSSDKIDNNNALGSKFDPINKTFSRDFAHDHKYDIDSKNNYIKEVSRINSLKDDKLRKKFLNEQVNYMKIDSYTNKKMQINNQHDISMFSFQNCIDTENADQNNRKLNNSYSENLLHSQPNNNFFNTENFINTEINYEKTSKVPCCSSLDIKDNCKIY